MNQLSQRVANEVVDDPRELFLKEREADPEIARGRRPAPPLIARLPAPHKRSAELDCDTSNGSRDNFVRLLLPRMRRRGGEPPEDGGFFCNN